MMKGDRVTVKVATLRELERLLLAGDSVSALELVQRRLDFVAQGRLMEIKGQLYQLCRDGKISRSDYLRRLAIVEAFLY